MEVIFFVLHAVFCLLSEKSWSETAVDVESQKLSKIKPVELSLCLSDKRITWKWENIFA